MTDKLEVYKVNDNTIKALGEAYVKNTYNLWKCNANLDAIRNWSDKQETIYVPSNK